MQTECDATVRIRRLSPAVRDASLFRRSRLLQHDDPVCLLNCGQAMCDDQRGTALHQRFQCGLHMAFRFAVEAEVASSRIRIGASFKWRAQWQCAGVVRRIVHAALADQRIQSLRPFLDKLHGMCCFCGSDNFSLADFAHLSIRYVRRNSVIEQHHSWLTRAILARKLARVSSARL